MEITYKKGAPTITQVKYNNRENFLRILYRIAKNLLWRGHGTNLVQLTHWTNYNTYGLEYFIEYRKLTCPTF